MKLSRAFPIIGAIVAALTVAVVVEAQPSGPVGIGRVTHDDSLSGSGTVANPLRMSPTVSGIITGTGSSGSPLTATEIGDISSVGAGSGLTGGGTSGALTIDFGCGTGLSCAADSVSVDTSVIQARVSSSCSAPNAIRAVAADGTVTCTTGTGSVTSLDSGAGLTGGPVTSSGTFAVGAGTNITVNADDVQVANALNQSASGKSTTVGDFRGTILTATLSSGQTDNWAPTGNATATVFEITTSGGNVTLTGLVGGVSGRIVHIHNAAASPNLVSIIGESTSTSTNRFRPSDNNTGNASVILRPNASAAFVYNGTRWMELSHFSYYNVIGDNNITSNGTLTVAGTATMGTMVTTSAYLTGPTQLAQTTSTVAADTNDFSMTSQNVTVGTFLNPTGADRTITGMANGQANRWVFLYNSSATLKVTLTNEDSASTAANRFTLPGAVSYVIQPGATVWLFYGGSSRWIVFGTNAGVGASGITTVGDFRGTIITPTLTADQTSWAPTGFATAAVFNTSVTGGSHIIRGLQGGVDGRRITIRNACQSSNCNITITSEDVLATTASERFFVGNNSDSASLTIYARDSVDFIYTESRWNIVRPASFDYATFGNAVSFAGAGTFSGGLVTAAGLTADGTITLNNGAGSTRLGNFKATRFAFTISGDQDDYAPTSNALASVLEITPSGAARTITGLVNGVDSRIVVIRNPLGTAQDLVLANDRTSTAANRFLFGGDLTLHPGDSVTLMYESIDSRWMLMNNMATNVGNLNNGQITLSTGTGTATVRSGAKCVCTDSTANASVKCAVSTTTLTATGTGSDVITYICF